MYKKHPDWDMVISPQRGWMELNIDEIWNYRDLLWLFVKRDLQHFINKQFLALCGFSSSLLITTIVFSVIFNKVAKISTDEFRLTCLLYVRYYSMELFFKLP